METCKLDRENSEDLQVWLYIDNIRESYGIEISKHLKAIEGITLNLKEAKRLMFTFWYWLKVDTPSRILVEEISKNQGPVITKKQGQDFVIEKDFVILRDKTKETKELKNHGEDFELIRWENKADGTRKLKQTITLSRGEAKFVFDKFYHAFGRKTLFRYSEIEDQEGGENG